MPGSWIKVKSPVSLTLTTSIYILQFTSIDLKESHRIKMKNIHREVDDENFEEWTHINQVTKVL